MIYLNVLVTNFYKLYPGVKCQNNQTYAKQSGDRLDHFIALSSENFTIASIF